MGNFVLRSLVQRPLQSQCRNYIEAVTTTEVIAQFHFGTDTQVKVFIHSLDAVQVYPKLRFGEEDGFSILGLFTPPVGKTGEGKQTSPTTKPERTSPKV